MSALSASEKTMVNNACMSMDSESEFKIMVPLMGGGGKIACPVCGKKEAHFFFVNLTDVDKPF